MDTTELDSIPTDKLQDHPIADHSLRRMEPKRRRVEVIARWMR